MSNAPGDVSHKFRLEGRAALVTGAGRGIGRSAAVALAYAGAEVWLMARTQSDLDSAVAEITAGGGRAHALVCDVTDAAAVNRAVAALPSLDVLVNNAGTNIPEPFVKVSEANLDKVLDLNIRAMFITAQAAVKKMLELPARKDQGGVVLNISSQMGHVGSPNRTVYCMTKHAVEGLTKAMAVELASQGIRVNSIGPTFADTPLVRRVVDTPEKLAFVTARIPLGSMCRVEDVMAAAVYLASPAAAMITGTHLLVDGGWTAQ